jgi:hypothetical protein
VVKYNSLLYLFLMVSFFCSAPEGGPASSGFAASGSGVTRRFSDDRKTVAFYEGGFIATQTTSKTVSGNYKVYYIASFNGKWLGGPEGVFKDLEAKYKSTYASLQATAKSAALGSIADTL